MYSFTVTREMLEFSIRPAVPNDYDRLGEVMFEAVRDGTPQYTDAQRFAWVPEPRSGPAWHNRLNLQTTFVAEDENSLLGFMSLVNNYVDFAYIRPAARGSGMFRMLYNEIEAVACRSNFKRLWTHSSLTAQPAFTAVGFHIKSKESVQIGDASLDRFEICLLYTSPSPRDQRGSRMPSSA